MKKQLLAALCFIVMSFICPAQQVKVNLGPEVSLKDGYFYDAVLYADASGYYVVKLKENDKGIDLHIEKFDYTHQSIFDHAFTTNMEHTYFVSIVQTRSNFQLIYYHDDVTKQMREIYTTIIDHSGTISTNPILLAAFPTNLKLEGSVTKIRGKGDLDFDVDVNADSTRLLLYASPTISADAPAQYYLKEFDLDGKVIQEKQIKTDWIEAQVLILGFEVDLQDNIFVMARVYKESKGKGKNIDFPETIGQFKNKVVNYDNKLLRYAKGSNTPKEYSLDVSGKILGDFFVSFTKNNDFILTSVYYHDIEQDAYEGTVYLRLDATGEIKAAMLDKFPSSIEKSASDDVLMKKDGVIMMGQHFNPFEGCAEADGSAMMACDFSYHSVDVDHYTDNPGPGGLGYTTTEKTYKFFNLDITCIKFSPEGKILWMTSIPLFRQSDKYSTHTSYGYGYNDDYGYNNLSAEQVEEFRPLFLGEIFFKAGNSYNFLYCDNKKNLEPDRINSSDPKKWDSDEYIVEMGAVDNATGKLSRTILFDRYKQDIKEQIEYENSSMITGSGGAMLFGYHGGTLTKEKYRFIQITLGN